MVHKYFPKAKNLPDHGQRLGALLHSQAALFTLESWVTEAGPHNRDDVTSCRAGLITV
jgi:hypothetical protein